MLLLTDRVDDRLDRCGSFMLWSHDEPEDVVIWLLCLSTVELCFNCLLSARKRSGDGGPSIAGSIKSCMPRPALWSVRRGEIGGDDIVGMSAAVFRRPPSEYILSRAN